MSQMILVCTQDSVLAKKLRFLLAHDDREVEVLDDPSRLETRVAVGGMSLLVVSRDLDGEDAVEILERLGARYDAVSTLVLGGRKVPCPEHITIIENPADSQSIYHHASQALAEDALLESDDMATDGNGEMLGASEEGLSFSDDTGQVPGEAEDTYFDLGNQIDRTVTTRMQRSTGQVVPHDERTDETRPLEELPDLEAEAPEGPADEEPWMAGTPSPDPEATPAPAEEEGSSALFTSGPPPDEEAAPEPAMDREITVFDVAGYHASTSDGEVEAVAKHNNSNLGLSGNVQPAALAKALFQCWTMEARGALAIQGRSESLTIFFEDGMPVFVTGDRPGDMLGRNLVQKGRISEDHYGRAAKRAIESGTEIGLALVELGVLTPEALGQEQGEQAHERIVQCFGWRGGRFDFTADREAPVEARPYRLLVGRVLTDGMRLQFPDDALNEVIGDGDTKYFRVRSPADVLLRRFPLNDREQAFLAYSGRAYNVRDAAELTGLDPRGARVLLGLLTIAEEIEDFVPGVAEFEERIKEERTRSQRPAPAATPQPSFIRPAPPAPIPPPQPMAAPGFGSGPRMPMSSPAAPLASSIPNQPSNPMMAAPGMMAAAREEPMGGFGEDEPPSLLFQGDNPDANGFPPGFMGQPNANRPANNNFGPMDDQVSHDSLFEGVDVDENAAQPPAMPQATARPPAPQPVPVAPKPTPAAQPAKVEPRPSIPPMPSANGSGRTPNEIVFSPPLARGPDGLLLDTPERQRSREHFQRGVGLLGQGNFDEAEDAFRDAVRLCAEEHVYLIGLARAIYYNPGYSAPGKLPVLRSIVDRARVLAPDDARVTALSEWVRYAESQHVGM